MSLERSTLVKQAGVWRRVIGLHHALTDILCEELGLEPHELLPLEVYILEHAARVDAQLAAVAEQFDEVSA